MVDLEKLIKLAKKDIKTASENNLDDVQLFIIATNLKKGTHIVAGRSIFCSYQLWSKKPLKKMEFFSIFSKTFNIDVKRNKPFYKLNISAWDLDEKVRNIISGV